MNIIGTGCRGGIIDQNKGNIRRKASSFGSKGDKGNGKAVSVKGDSYSITPGSHEFYFDTTATRIAMHLKFQDSRSNQSIYLHVTNMDPFVTGTELQIAGSPLNKSNLIVDPTGYRNLAGGVLFTIVPPSAKADSSPDED